MKQTLFLLIFLINLFIGCSNEEEQKLEVFNPEVFAFDLGEEYEVNATVRIKGYNYKQLGEEFRASFNYEIDLVKPDGTTITSVVKDSEELIFNEEVRDAGMDIQFNLDSSNTSGEYTLYFNIKDMYSGKTGSTSAKLILD